MDTVTLKRDFESLEKGTHLCCFYKSKKEQFSIVIPFILTGLENNEKCIYIVDENTKKDIKTALKKVVDLEKFLHSNQLEIVTQKDAYVRDGSFDPDRMIELLARNEEKARQDAYTGLRVTGEMTWILSELPGVERLIEYEAKLNYFFPNSTCIALCQYNENAFDPQILLDVIRTHPVLVIYNSLYENPRYVSPEEFAQMKGEVSWEMYEKAKDDIIRKKEMDERAKKIEKERKLILDSITESVIYYGMDKRIQWANKAAAEAVNAQPEDLIGKMCSEIWRSRESQCTFCPLIKAWDSKTYQEGEITTPAGRIWHARANPVYENNEMVGVVTVGRDITERKQAEEALKRSEENFRLFFENEPEYCYMISPEGVILDINKSALKMLGFKKEEIVGSPLLTSVYAESSREKARHLFWKWKKEGVLRNEELTIVTKEGKERIVLLSAAAMRDSKGDIIHSISVQRDITEKKKAEEQIKRSLKEKEVLIKEIHHRVKNNMQIILSLLNLQSATIENTELGTLFKASQRRIKSIAAIHNELYRSKDFTNINFSDVISILAEDLIQSYRTDISLNVDAEPVYLGIDAAIPCGLIINELVSNAAKHAFPDGGGEIFIQVRAHKRAVELTVADNGVGIPNTIDFRTAESLGLSLVTVLAEEQLNGTIDLDRSKGTVFCITFEK